MGLEIISSAVGGDEGKKVRKEKDIQSDGRKIIKMTVIEEGSRCLSREE